MTFFLFLATVWLRSMWLNSAEIAWLVCDSWRDRNFLALCTVKENSCCQLLLIADALKSAVSGFLILRCSKITCPHSERFQTVWEISGYSNSESPREEKEGRGSDLTYLRHIDTTGKLGPDLLKQYPGCQRQFLGMTKCFIFRWSSIHESTLRENLKCIFFLCVNNECYVFTWWVKTRGF